MPEELTDPTATNTQMKQRLAQLAANATSKEEFLTGLSSTLRNVDLKSEDLFKHWETLGYTNNMPVRRYTAVSTFNDYAVGTYQSLSNEYVELSVAASGSSSIKHYYDTGIAAQKFEAEFKVTLQNVVGDGIGIGFKNGENYNIVAFSSSGNLSTVSGFTNTLVTSGLGGYGLGDTVKFVYDGTYVNVYVNDVFKGKNSLSQGGMIVIGQIGFSHYLSIVASKSKDPIRDYVSNEVSKIPEPDPSILPQAKSYTESYTYDKSLDLFKTTVNIPYLNNMDVTRFTAVSTSNTYPSGTYQSLNGDKVNLSVTKSGSSAIKHYFVSDISAQKLTAEFKLTLQDISGDSIGIGFKNGESYSLVAFSSSGNLYTFSGFASTTLKTGLGGYVVGDTVKFELSGNNVKIYVNNIFKVEHTLDSTVGLLIIGQGGFSRYESSVKGAVIDPIRNYVEEKINATSGGVFSPAYYSYDSVNSKFFAYSKVKGNLYVGFEVRHEIDMSEVIYLDYWRLYQAMFYTLENETMVGTGRYAVIGGENEFVFKQNSTKDDFTGGYHGDELVTSIVFLADGLPISTSADIPLTAANKVEYIEKSTMHETASSGVIVEGHPIIAYHTKHTEFVNGGYKTWNRAIWNYSGTMSTLYHGISCISKDVASVGFSDDTFTDQAFTGSDVNYFTAIGTRLFKARNATNGLAVEATSYQIKVDGADELSELFVKDRTNDSKYYRKSPPRVVEVGEVHESYFECRFFVN